MITSAGIVLAGTFSVLAVLPLVFLTEIGFTIAFGVLLDTFVVRSVLVPALVFDIGDRVWWPSKLSRREGYPPPVPEPEVESGEVAGISARRRRRARPKPDRAARQRAAGATTSR